MPCGETTFCNICKIWCNCGVPHENRLGHALCWECKSLEDLNKLDKGELLLERMFEDKHGKPFLLQFVITKVWVETKLLWWTVHQPAFRVQILEGCKPVSWQWCPGNKKPVTILYSAKSVVKYVLNV